tara:strand:- start:4741 stop:6027 length:1287 start_codon:yes stop_codon:yes gene_type:complete
MSEASGRSPKVMTRGRFWVYPMYAAYGVDLYLDYALFAAFVLFAYNGGAWEAAALAVAFTAPGIIVGPILGARISRPSATAYILMSAFVIGATSIALWLFQGAYWYILIALIRASARLSLKIALPVLVAHRFHQREYTGAHSLLQGILNGGKILGPALAGVVLMKFGYVALIVCSNIISVCLLASASLVHLATPTRIRRFAESGSAGAFSGGRHPITSIRLSLRALVSSNGACVGAIAFSLSTFALYISDDLLALLLKHHDFSSQDVAFSIAIIGGGGIIGSLLAEPILRVVGALNLFLIAILSDTICFAVYGYAFPFVEGSLQYFLAALTVGLMGIGVGLGAVGFGVLIQNEVPTRLIAPVTSSANAIGSALALTGPVLGAVLVDLMSVEFPFKVTAVLMGAVLFSCVFYSLKLNDTFTQNEEEAPR